MTAGDLLLMIAVTMIYQYTSTGCFTEIRKLMSHDLNIKGDFFLNEELHFYGSDLISENIQLKNNAR